MKIISKNKSDVILGLLFVESLLLSLVIENKAIYWLLFAAFCLTTLFYTAMVLKVPIQGFLGSKKRDDVIFSVFMTSVLAANIMVFSNRLLLGIIFMFYFLGFRFLVHMFNENITQIKRNALNLAVLFTIFLGINFLTNVTIVVQSVLGEVVVVASSILTFAFIYLVTSYNFVKNGISKKLTKVYSTVFGFLLTETALIAGFYLERYPTIYKVESTSDMSIVTLPLFMVVIYYLLYGLSIHKIQNKFNSRVIIEYIGVSTVIMATLFITIRWLGAA